MASRLTACEQFSDCVSSTYQFARTHLEKNRDVFQRTFTRLKRKLKQFELVCVIHSHFKGLQEFWRVCVRAFSRDQHGSGASGQPEDLDAEVAWLLELRRRRKSPSGFAGAFQAPRNSVYVRTAITDSAVASFCGSSRKRSPVVLCDRCAHNALVCEIRDRCRAFADALRRQKAKVVFWSSMQQPDDQNCRDRSSA